MRESSFCGCCSLKSGALTIGLLHLICAPLLWQFADYVHYDFRQWSPILIMLIPLSILLLIGTISRNVDYVFPFVCMSFVIILLSICHISNQLVKTAFWRYEHLDHATLILFEAIAIIVMIYFFTVSFAFYQELLHEKFTSSLPINDSVESKKAVNIHSILNNFDYEQAIKKNSDKVAILKSEESKISMA